MKKDFWNLRFQNNWNLNFSPIKMNRTNPKQHKSYKLSPTDADEMFGVPPITITAAVTDIQSKLTNLI